jgi:RNA recognition motif-containing protein
MGLKYHFSQFGEVKRAEVKTDSTGQSRGFGTVIYWSKEDAKLRLKD